MSVEDELQKTLNQLRFSEMINLLRLLAIKYTTNTKYYPLKTGTKTWRIRIPPPIDFAKPLSEEISPWTMPVKDITLPLIEFFGTHIAYCEEIDTIAYWVPDRTKIELQFDDSEFMRSMEKARRSLEKIGRPYATCYVCGDHVGVDEDEWLSGYSNPGKVLVAMHSGCAAKREITVCADCQEVVSVYDTDVNNVCKKCRVKEEPIKIITDERLSEIEKKANIATPGPWKREGGTPPSIVTEASYSCLGEGRTIRDGKGDTVGHFVGVCSGTKHPQTWKENWNDMDFIAASRTVVPELIGEIRKLKKLYFDLRGD